MKILMLDAACTSLPYDHSLCEALVKKGCTVDFFGSEYVHTKWTNKPSYNFISHFYRFTHWLYRGNARGLFRQYVKTIEHVFNMFHFVRLVKKHNPDIIHFQWSQLPFIDQRFLKKLKKTAPLVYTIHNSTPLHGEKHSFSFLQKVDSHFLDYFDSYIAHTKYSKDVTSKRFSVSQKKISIIPHGLLNYNSPKKSSFVSVHKKYGLSGKEKIILLFGGISPYKGLDILIKGFAKIPKSLRDETRLLIVGRANMDMKNIYKLVDSLKIGEQIIWDLRFIKENEVPEIFNGCSLVALPYRHVDQSGVLMTMISYGMPIVASKIGGFEELLKDGKHGYLFDLEDTNSLAKSLEKILGNEKLTKQMGKSVQSLADQWSSWDKISRYTIEAYQKLL